MNLELNLLLKRVDGIFGRVVQTPSGFEICSLDGDQDRQLQDMIEWDNILEDPDCVTMLTEHAAK